MELKIKEYPKPIIVVDLINGECKTLQFEDATIDEAYEILKGIIPQVKKKDAESNKKLLVQIQERLGKERLGTKSYITYIGLTPNEAKDLLVKKFTA